jgi:putative membrane protein
VWAAAATVFVVEHRRLPEQGDKAMMGYGYYGDMMGGFGWVWMVLVLAVVIALVVWGTRTAFWTHSATSESSGLEILRRRYAAGEITATEFEQAKRAIA